MDTIITTDSGSNPRNTNNMAPCVIYDDKNNLYYDIKKEFNKYLKNIVNDNNKTLYDPNYFTLLVTGLKEIDIDDAKTYLESLNYFDVSLIKELPFYGVISAYGVEDQVGIALIKKK